MRTAEQHFALREGHHNAAAEAYFDARPELDLPLGRKTFEAGFVRAFDLLAAARNGAMHSLNLIGTGPGVYLAGREQIEALQRACAFALATEPPAQKGAQR